MSLLTDITAVFDSMYAAFRSDVQGMGSSLKLYDDDDVLLATITDGWLSTEVTQEQTFERVTELHITDRSGIAFDDVTFFIWDGIRYERRQSPNPPVNNPREWVWWVKPIGVETTTIGTVLRFSETTYAAAATDVAIKVSA